MRLIAERKGQEIWAEFEATAQVYELFWDGEGESFTGWVVDSLKDAVAAAPIIFDNQ